MKLLLLFVSLIVCDSLTAQYIFNFGGGKSGLWSNPANWVGGMVPPSTVNTVTILPPDNTSGWLCQLDVDGVVCNSKLIIDKHATFEILNGKNIFCHDSIKVTKDAQLVVAGEISIICPVKILNDGSVHISGSIHFDGETFCSPGELTTFTNNGPLYTSGNISGERFVITCNNVFRNKGTIALGFTSVLDCKGDATNDGSITGDISMSVKNLVNNGTIELVQTGFSGFRSTGILVNNNKIDVYRSLYLKGILVNNGFLSTNESGDWIFDTVHIFNKNAIYLTNATTAIFKGSLYNLGNFNCQSFLQPAAWEMDIINDGYFETATTHFNKGSVINNMEMTLTVNSDSNRIKVPFINKGHLVTVGPIVLNDAFVNVGTFDTQ